MGRGRAIASLIIGFVFLILVVASVANAYSMATGVPSEYQGLINDMVGVLIGGFVFGFLAGALIVAGIMDLMREKKGAAPT